MGPPGPWFEAAVPFEIERRRAHRPSRRDPVITGHLGFRPSIEPDRRDHEPRERHPNPLFLRSARCRETWRNDVVNSDTAGGTPVLSQDIVDGCLGTSWTPITPGAGSPSSDPASGDVGVPRLRSAPLRLSRQRARSRSSSKELGQLKSSGVLTEAEFRGAEGEDPGWLRTPDGVNHPDGRMLG